MNYISIISIFSIIVNSNNDIYKDIAYSSRLACLDDKACVMADDIMDNLRDRKEDLFQNCSKCKDGQICKTRCEENVLGLGQGQFQFDEGLSQGLSGCMEEFIPDFQSCVDQCPFSNPELVLQKNNKCHEDCFKPLKSQASICIKRKNKINIGKIVNCSSKCAETRNTLVDLKECRNQCYSPFAKSLRLRLPNERKLKEIDKITIDLSIKKKIMDQYKSNSHSIYCFSVGLLIFFI